MRLSFALRQALKLAAEWRTTEGWLERFAAAEVADDYDWTYVARARLLPLLSFRPSLFSSATDRPRVPPLRTLPLVV